MKTWIILTLVATTVTSVPVNKTRKDAELLKVTQPSDSKPDLRFFGTDEESFENSKENSAESNSDESNWQFYDNLALFATFKDPKSQNSVMVIKKLPMDIQSPEFTFYLASLLSQTDTLPKSNLTVPVPNEKHILDTNASSKPKIDPTLSKDPTLLVNSPPKEDMRPAKNPVPINDSKSVVNPIPIGNSLPVVVSASKTTSAPLLDTSTKTTAPLPSSTLIAETTPKTSKYVPVTSVTSITLKKVTASPK